MKLEEICEDVLTRYLDRVAFASDASFYRQVPRAVARPKSLDEVARLFAWSQAHKVPLVFRAAGTSLSGQAITDGVLVDVSRHWRGFSVHQPDAKNTTIVQTQPGVVGGHLNTYLKSLGQKIGPDPASIQSCMLGGILANNASGMCCGVKDNAYHTLESMVFMLPDGKSYDSALDSHRERFELEQRDLCQTLSALRQQILGSPLLERIRRKYRQKNTVGYSLNAFVDFEHPIDIFTHVLIGSEGTLAFIAEARLRTVPAHPFSSTGLLFFKDLAAACEHVHLLAPHCQAIELMDAASLRSLSAEALNSWFEGFHQRDDAPCALLIESQAATEDALENTLQHLQHLTQAFPLLQPFTMTRDSEQQAALWKIRKGLYPSVGAVRQRGTSVIIEDVVFPPEHMVVGITGLQQLFTDHHYEGIIFGHARDGNVHFVITQGFSTPADTRRYELFMEAVVRHVLSLDGALKAEHGTGRNMAPFVETEWGQEAFDIMRVLKNKVDPHHCLNPGVIINADPQAHLKDLKDLPRIDEGVDRCTECGFCEPVCPSRRLTLTPRQRIVLRREQQRLLHEPDRQKELAELNADYVYAALDTCATDSLCASACPIGIDTGALVKQLRQERLPALLQQFTTQTTRFPESFALGETAIKMALTTAHTLQKTPAKHMFTPLPLWHEDLPPASHKALPVTQADAAAFVYFPSCLSRNLGYEPSQDMPHTDLPHVILALCEAAGIRVHLPPETRGHCCSLPFASKGLAGAAENTLKHAGDMLWNASHHGHLPVIMDTSPCSYHLQTHLQRQGLQIMDFVDFCDRYLLPALTLEPVFESLYVHPVCSVQKMNLTPALMRIARRCAERVIAPAVPTCCGTAGDRGLLYPELPEAALMDVKAELQARPPEALCSSSRSCEMGLSLTLDAPVVSLAHILYRALKP